MLSLVRKAPASAFLVIHDSPTEDQPGEQFVAARRRWARLFPATTAVPTLRIQAKERGGRSMAKEKLVVIGGDAAGMSAASQAKRRRRDMEIVVFERSPHTSYSA